MSWTERALAVLSESAQDGGWGYRPGAPPSAEPTALAHLALASHGREAPGAEYLARLQGQDGAVGLTAELPRPYWPTPLAMLVWLKTVGSASRVERAARFLLEIQGTTFPNDGLVGQDTELVGWPWVAATHSWLEPTSYCVIALTRAGHQDHPRVRAGREVILDRICAGGGWNYGCPAMLGNDAQPFPAPTGIALLALRDLAADPRLLESIEYLIRRVPLTRSPLSLGWGVLGLAAAKRLPAEHRGWLEESYAQLEKRGHGILETAMLVLAANPQPSLASLAVPEAA